jgi:PTS system mannitol-specific IIC component
MNPILIVAAIAGGVVGTLLFTIFNVGLVGVASPGSIITLLMMAATGDRIKIVIAILAAAAVSFVIASFFVKRSNANSEDINKELKEAAKQMEQLKGKKSRISSVFDNDETIEIDYATVQKIAYACDAGLGSSAMGSTVINKKLKKAGITDVKVFHTSVAELPTQADIIVTHISLIERAKKAQPDTKIITIEDYLNAPEYEELVQNILDARSNS